MKHHEITKERTGWISATITRPDGTKESYKNFFNKEEATIWAYAKIRRLYGPETANEEF
jgi:hypothetical protein